MVSRYPVDEKARKTARKLVPTRNMGGAEACSFLVSVFPEMVGGDVFSVGCRDFRREE